MVHGKTVGVDSTTLEANGAMQSIVRKDTGEDWQEYVTGLMRQSARGVRHVRHPVLKSFNPSRFVFSFDNGKMN